MFNELKKVPTKIYFPWSPYMIIFFTALDEYMFI